MKDAKPFVAGARKTRARPKGGQLESVGEEAALARRLRQAAALEMRGIEDAMRQGADLEKTLRTLSSLVKALGDLRRFEDETSARDHATGAGVHRSEAEAIGSEHDQDRERHRLRCELARRLGLPLPDAIAPA